MATQQIEFEAPFGATINSATLHLAGSDAIAYTASALTLQTNRNNIWRATFAGIAANKYQLIAKSKGVTLPENFSLRFTSLWQLKDTEKADIAQKVATTISGAYADGLISQKTALQELRDLGRVTGVFTNITDEMIEAADDTLAPPGGMGEGAELGGEDPVAQVLALYGKKENSDEPKGAPGTADHGASRRIRLQP
jgi:hypothetical protein